MDRVEYDMPDFFSQYFLFSPTFFRFSFLIFFYFLFQVLRHSGHNKSYRHEYLTVQPNSLERDKNNNENGNGNENSENVPGGNVLQGNVLEEDLFGDKDSDDEDPTVRPLLESRSIKINKEIKEDENNGNNRENGNSGENGDAESKVSLDSDVHANSMMNGNGTDSAAASQSQSLSQYVSADMGQIESKEEDPESFDSNRSSNKRGREE